MVLDSEGSRVAVKYWDAALLNSKTPDDLKTQMTFEKKVFAKTVRQQRQDGFDSIRQTNGRDERSSRCMCGPRSMCWLTRSLVVVACWWFLQPR